MGTARIGDFGLMIMTELTTILLSNTAIASCGTTRWMSPELLDPVHFRSDGLPSRQSDCYALGMAIYEVSGLLSFLRSPPIYPSLGTERTFPIPPLAISRRCGCDTQGRASGGASECLDSWFH